MTTESAPSTTPLRVVHANDLESLEAHAAAWDALAAATAAAEPLLMTSHAWTASHLEHRLEPGTTWACYLAYEGEELLGVLPVVRRRHSLFGNWRPLLRVPCDFHTRDGDVALAAGREAEALRALLDAVREKEGPYLELSFGGLRDGSPTLPALAAASRGAVHCAPDLAGRTLKVGDWETYEGGLKPKSRRNLRTARKRCDAAGAAVRVLDGAAAAPDLFHRFTELESSGWKAREGTSIESQATSRAFYETLVRRLAARGWLQWDVLQADDRWLAISLGVRFGRSLVLLKTAHDEAERKLSPGKVLLDAILKRTFERRDAEVVDLLSDSAWLELWNMDRTPYHSAFLYPRGVLPVIFGSAPRKLRPLAKRLLRRAKPDDGSAS